jgi:hypothetical protein
MAKEDGPWWRNNECGACELVADFGQTTASASRQTRQMVAGRKGQQDL